jgi:aspartate/methionine/tyrosine aminotransferase
VLVAPGEYLGMQNYLRITVGYEPEKVRKALAAISEALASLPQTMTAAH